LRRKPKKQRSRWNVFRYIDPSLAWKAAAGIGVWAGSLATVKHQGSVETAEATDAAQASASVAVYAAGQVDSLRAEVVRLKGRVSVLERATPQEKLAEARRPTLAKSHKPGWWRLW